MNSTATSEPQKPAPIRRTDGLGRITVEEMYRAVSGKAAMAEHDANVAQRCGLHGEQLESVKRYAATLRAAANKLRPKCPECGGRGKIYRHVPKHAIAMPGVEDDWTYEDQTCWRCHGDGIARSLGVALRPNDQANRPEAINAK